MGKGQAPVRDSRGRVISKENATEYRQEKRMKELGQKGYNTFNVRYMMGHDKFSERQIAKAMRNDNIKTDGKI